MLTDKEVLRWFDRLTLSHRGMVDAVPMNYFEAVGVFYAFMDSKPCWQRETR